MEQDSAGSDICRVCRSEGLPDRPLFHPCICAGSIKFIHQECLVQWMRYSRKEFCELCGHRFSFMPIYSPDMPRRLPLRDVAGGLLVSVVTGVKDWCHYTLVALAWLGIVPLTACRIYRALFSNNLDSFVTILFDMLSTENLAKDIFSGCFVVTCTLFAFIGLVWLREQIMHGGGPEWLERDNQGPAQGQGDGREAAPPDNNNLPPEEVVGEVVGGAAAAGGERAAAVGGPAAAGGVDGVDAINRGAAALPGGGAAGDGAEGNWNPMEWDRAAEELTWERLLGLDGSMVFLEHVFWVVSLNTLFIVIFAFCPYHMGAAGVAALGLGERVQASHFRGLLTTLAGYEVIGVLLAALHAFSGLLGLRRARRVLGLCYVVVKVSLLSVVEIGVLPLVCGWWLDICSLALFDATLKDREAGLAAAPWTSMFIHWLVGMVYVYYFASFILLLREVLRPGVLWFLKNLNDPDFSPIQEMIHLPILRHLHSLVASAVIFGTAVLLMLWVPSRLLRNLFPGFLPYVVATHADAPVNELSLELLLLQVILPALLEQSHTRTWLKWLVRWWCSTVAGALGLRSYLLGNRPQPPAAGPEPPPPGGLGAAHQALLQREGPTGWQPYDKPSAFGLRLVALLVAVCVSLVIASAIALVVPVWLGRRVMALWLPKLSEGVHELYTAACGTYLCWLLARALSLVCMWLPMGRALVARRIMDWGGVALRSSVACAALLGAIPLLFGLLLELVLVVPLRVPLDQTPVLFVWQDWALGVLYTKIACAMAMMGPETRMKAAIEKAYRDGIVGMDLKFILCELAAPVIVCFGLALSIPYAIAHSLVPLVVTSPQMRNLIARRIYPFLLLSAFVGCIVVFQIRQFRKLYEHIKNDKYLVGQRLVNYDHRRQKPQTISIQNG